MLKQLYDIFTQSRVKRRVKKTSLELTDQRNKSFQTKLAIIDERVEIIRTDIEQVNKINQSESLWQVQILAHEHYLKHLYCQLDSLLKHRQDVIDIEMRYQVEILAKLNNFTATNNKDIND